MMQNRGSSELRYSGIVPLAVHDDVTDALLTDQTAQVVADHAGDVGIVTGDGGGDADFLEDDSVVEEVEHIGLIGNAHQLAAANLTAGTDQTGDGGLFVVVLLGQLLQVQQVGSEGGVDAVDVLIENIDDLASVQSGLQTLTDAGTALELQVDLDAGLLGELLDGRSDSLALRLSGPPHCPVDDSLGVGICTAAFYAIYTKSDKQTMETIPFCIFTTDSGISCHCHVITRAFHTEVAFVHRG